MTTQSCEWACLSAAAALDFCFALKQNNANFLVVFVILLQPRIL